MREAVAPTPRTAVRARPVPAGNPAGEWHAKGTPPLEAPVAQAAGAAATENQPRAIVERHGVAAASLGRDLANVIAVDDRGSMDAREAIGIEPALEIRERSRDEIALAAPWTRVVAFRLDPRDARRDRDHAP